ncbi:MAG: hypothetical protein J6S21_04640 [Victivallales bacterium]|nr:hypothetical protein [Victivallales bacterium]
MTLALLAGLHGGEMVVLPTISRVPSATRKVTAEFDRQIRESAARSKMQLVSVEETGKALERFCISAEMPVYNAKRLQDMAKHLRAKRMYRIVIQNFSVYSRQLRTAESPNGDTFYFGRLQGTVQRINSSGLVEEARIFTVNLDTMHTPPPAESAEWNAELLAMEMIREAVMRKIPVLGDAG